MFDSYPLRHADQQLWAPLPLDFYPRNRRRIEAIEENQIQIFGRGGEVFVA